MRKAAWVVALAAAVISSCGSSKPDFEKWALPDFQFSDYPALGTLFVTGTLKGRGIGYPVNTWNIQCFKQDMTCHVANISEIGKRQLGDLWLEDWAVTSWSDNAIILVQNDATSCAKNIIVMNRVAKAVSYTSTPANQDKDYCKGYNKFVGSPPSNEKWEIGQPVKPWEAASPD